MMRKISLGKEISEYTAYDARGEAAALSKKKRSGYRRHTSRKPRGPELLQDQKVGKRMREFSGQEPPQG